MKTHVFRHSLHTPWTYQLLDRLQREVFQTLIQDGEGAVILSEVAPVVTLGRRGTLVPIVAEKLTRAGIQIYETDRGGAETYHGPGQWVLFVVDRLERLVGDSKGVRKSVNALLEIGKQTAQAYGQNPRIELKDQAGLWTDKGKLGSVGVRIEKGVLLHGLSLNVFRTPESFAEIRPCGLDCKPDFIFDNRPSGADAFDEIGRTILKAVDQVFL